MVPRPSQTVIVSVEMAGKSTSNNAMITTKSTMTAAIVCVKLKTGGVVPEEHQFHRVLVLISFPLDR